MFVDFDTLPAEAKIWVYQADRCLNDAELDSLGNRFRIFSDSWDSHGKNLKNSFRFFHNYFIVIGVDENYTTASGCSIDKSVDFIRKAEQEFMVNFLDRSRIAFEIDNVIQQYSFNNLKMYIKNQTIRPENLMFNNTVATMDEFRKKWKIPAGETWISKYFNK